MEERTGCLATGAAAGLLKKTCINLHISAQ